MTIVANTTGSTLRKSFKWIPNALTASRIILGFFVLALYIGPSTSVNHSIAFYIAICAVLTDLFDGWIARLFGWTSDVGKWFDPLADKIFSLAVGIAIVVEYGWGFYLVPYLIASGFILKYAIATTRLRRTGRIGGASGLAKVKTAVLMIAQLFFMGDISFAESLSPEGRTVLLVLGLMLLAVAAYLNKLSLAGYRRISDKDADYYERDEL